MTSMTSGKDGAASLVVGTTAFLELPGDEAVLVAADLEYRPGDCWAVMLVLRGPDGEEVCWTFAWELFAAGLLAPGGHGDVRVRPLRRGNGMVEVALRRSSGAILLFPARDIGEFVSKVRQAVREDVLTARQGLDAELAVITEQA
jgi:hypothetical protein